MKVLCTNPGAQFYNYQTEIEEGVSNVLRSNSYIMGNHVKNFEKDFSRYIGVKFGVGVANGTDAIEIALRALEIGQGDEVITVSHTAVATVAAIEAAGAKPVLVDIDLNSYTINPLNLKDALTANTKAILVVHLYGQAAYLDDIIDFCEKYNLNLVEDCSQAHGAKINGKRLGSIGKIACFSCYPTKNLGALGDAGIITTNDYVLAEKCKMIREYGWKTKFTSELIGRNSRLDEIQACILNIKLKYLDKNNKQRRNIAENYNSLINNQFIKTPVVRDINYHVYHLYVVYTDFRDQLLEYLKELDILAGIHYPVPIHDQPAYKNRIQVAGTLKNTNLVSRKILSLPMYPELTNNQVEYIIQAINKFKT